MSNNNTPDHVTGDRAGDLLGQLKMNEQYKLEQQTAQLKRREETGEKLLVSLAELSGKSEERVIQIVGRMASLNVDLDWPRIVGLIHSFFITDLNIDEGNAALLELQNNHDTSLTIKKNRNRAI